MRFCSFLIDGKLEAGLVVSSGQVVSADKAAGRLDWDRSLKPRDLLALEDPRRSELVESAAGLAASGQIEGTLDSLDLAAPISDPEKIICLGLNYRDHAEEAGLDLPVAPVLFAKFRESLIGSGQAIIPPPGDLHLDYEGELAVVVGKAGRGIAVKDALAHVGGVMPLNDVSARVLQTQTGQWMAGKAIDTFAPCGPYVTTMDEVDDIQNLSIKTTVNGVLLQDGNTSNQIFGVAETIAWLSTLMTLTPGDIIATGTPSGVGFVRDPPVLLGENDSVTVEIGGIGTLTNPVGAAADLRGPLTQFAAIA